MTERLRLHIGCGRDSIPGYDGVDIVAGPNVKYVVDLERVPWPFGSDSVEDILMYNVLEHLSDTVKTLDEVHRVLLPGGTVTIKVPYYGSYGAATDPTHKRFFSEDTMNYFTEDGLTEHSKYNYYGKSRFRIRSRFLAQRNALLRRLPEKIQLFCGHHLQTISDITWVLEAVK